MPDLAREFLLMIGIVAATVTLHLMGLTALTQITRAQIEHLRTPWLSLDRLLTPLGMVSGLFLPVSAQPSRRDRRPFRHAHDLQRENALEQHLRGD